MSVELQRLPTALLVVCVLCSFCPPERARANNLDTEYPIVFQGSPESYFGYNVALVNNTDGNLALVAAIKDNSTYVRELRRPGVLYKCRLVGEQTGSQSCTEVPVNTEGNKPGGDPYNEESQFVALKDDMDLGMTLTLQPGGNGRIVVCAPRWKNQKYENMYYMNGICYVLNRDMTRVEQLRPLIRKRLQVISSLDRVTRRELTINHYSVGEAGFSAVVTANNELVLGAPGCQDWTGTLVEYKVPEGPGGDVSLSKIGAHIFTKMNRTQQYIGYAVATGRFLDALGRSVAAGAPRDTPDYRGAVYFFNFLDSKSSELHVQMKKEGEQMGSYFGAALLALDLDHNGFSDLLVGAPLYSLQGNHGDEGKIYVFLSNGYNLQLQDGSIMGAGVAGSRFGMTIAHAGDLNMDGHPDVAVGAPYENDHGAVYIYNSWNRGLRTKYAQRIEARQLNALPRGFGIGISQGMDVDGNHYPDLLVGAYDSSSAFLFRTVPVVQTTAWIEIETRHISSSKPNCDLTGRPMICFPVTPCISYNGTYVPDQIDFDYTLEMDIKKNGSERGFFSSGSETAMIRQKAKLQREKAVCFQWKAYVYPDVKDLVTPFEFRLSYDISRPRRDTFCKECATVDPSSQKVVTNKTAFKLECGDKNICLSDLILQASISGHERGSPLIVGKDDVVTLNVNVKNDDGKQPAYLSRVVVDLSEGIDIVNLASCEMRNSSTLECDVGNPMRAGQEVSLAIKLSSAKIKDMINITVSALTDSEDTNPANNVVIIALPLIYEGDVSIEGAASVTQYVYNETSELLPVVHIFTVVKYHDSPIYKVATTIEVPYRVMGKKEPFLTLQSFVVDDDSRGRVGGTCVSPMDSRLKGRSAGPNSKVPRHRREANPAPLLDSPFPKAQVKMLKLDCTSAECIRYTCQMGPFVSQWKSAKVTLSMMINISALMEQVGMPDTIDVVSMGKITVLDDTEFTHLVKPRPKWTEITTSLIKEGPPSPYQLPWWAYLLIVLLGLLVLFLIMFVLYKCGFFRRKVKEELEEEKRKSLAVPPSPEVSPSDDPEVRRSLLAPDKED